MRPDSDDVARVARAPAEQEHRAREEREEREERAGRVRAHAERLARVDGTMRAATGAFRRHLAAVLDELVRGEGP